MFINIYVFIFFCAEIVRPVFPILDTKFKLTKL